MPLNHNRFHELAEQCWEPPPTGDFDYVKFGQLVVAECAVEIQAAVDRREPASTYVSWLKQHFGINMSTLLEEQMRAECEDRLLALLGSEHLVERWWYSPNREFGMVNPQQVWLEEPQQVLDYLRRF